MLAQARRLEAAAAGVCEVAAGLRQVLRSVPIHWTSTGADAFQDAVARRIRHAELLAQALARVASSVRSWAGCCTEVEEWTRRAQAAVVSADPVVAAHLEATCRARAWHAWSQGRARLAAALAEAGALTGVAAGSPMSGAWTGPVATPLSQLADLATMAVSSPARAGSVVDGRADALRAQARRWSDGPAGSAYQQAVGRSLGREVDRRTEVATAARALGERIPGSTVWSRTAGDLVPSGGRSLIRSAGRRIPLVGLVVTGWGAGHEIARGADPLEVSASTIASTVLGSLAFTALVVGLVAVGAGPVVVVVGAAVVAAAVSWVAGALVSSWIHHRRQPARPQEHGRAQ